MRSRPTLALAVVLALLATVFPTNTANAQGNTVTETIVSPNSGRVWKTHRDGVEQGTAWRQLGFDDSAWTDTPMKFYESHGNVQGDGWYAYYFREEFEITDIHQISELHLDLYYDDAAVLYLNGVEVYRSIRNNLPSLDEIAVGDVIPVDTLVSVGGAEDYYVQIPASSNYCEQGCVNDGATSAVDVALLQEGTNVFAAMAWTRPTSDLGFDLAFDVVRDLDAPLPDQVLINEIVASNDTNLDEDGDTPDWFELHNPGDTDVSLAGWTVEDSLTSWAFPDVTIAAGDHLLVWASNKDRAIAGSPLHTNFKISKEVDSLRLIDADSIVRDEWADLPRQLVDVAYGRVADGDTIGYLAAATPGATNAAASEALPPVIRPFSNRLYNIGDPVDLGIDAFDPEGGTLGYEMANNQGFGVDGDGRITGTATVAGEFLYTIRVTDQAGQATTQLVRFTIVEAASATTPLVLNEYNAVAPHKELAAGEDPAFGPAPGNGGDWYEFLVVDDLLDLRGWSIQLWDRDRADEIMERAALLVFGDDFRLAALPAGAIITISEDRPDDLSFDPDNGDWTLHLQASDDSPGAMFAVQENFNSTRSDQQVEIRDAEGVLRSPIVGETEPWDQLVGGVNGGEVMNLCADPTADDRVDPIADYRDNATASTFGAPNQCRWLDDAGQMVTFDQDLAPLRATTGVRGDVNCDGRADVIDALLISQYTVGVRTDAGVCPLPDPTGQVNIAQGDFDVSDGATIIDALHIARCTVGINNRGYCAD